MIWANLDRNLTRETFEMDQTAREIELRDSTIRRREDEILQLRDSLEESSRRHRKFVRITVAVSALVVSFLMFSPGFAILSDTSFRDRVDSERRRAVQDELNEMFSDSGYLEATFLCSAGMMWDKDLLWDDLLEVFERDYDLFALYDSCFDPAGYSYYYGP